MDARIPYVVSLWPVLCPLDSYHERNEYENRGGGYAPGDAGAVFWKRYWETEEAMSEGSPVLALERGEKLELPHVLYMKNRHEPADARLGDRSELVVFCAGHGMTPGSSSSMRAPRGRSPAA